MKKFEDFREHLRWLDNSFCNPCPVHSVFQSYPPQNCSLIYPLTSITAALDNVILSCRKICGYNIILSWWSNKRYVNNRKQGPFHVQMLSTYVGSLHEDTQDHRSLVHALAMPVIFRTLLSNPAIQLAVHSLIWVKHLTFSHALTSITCLCRTF